MNYKVLNIGTATALVAYWRQHSINVTLNVLGQYVELTSEAGHPCWREINDAFVAGRVSLVG